MPSSVTSMPGYMSFEPFPYLKEIVDCFDVDSPVQQIDLKKGVQVGYTTILESMLLYAMAHVKTLPVMLMTADKDLADMRVENNILPMLQQSDFSHVIRSSDEGNSRKTGKTAKQIQWVGGGYMVPFGANSAAKMRSFSICFMLKDEIDAWPVTVGKDGCPDALSDDRTTGYAQRKKIVRGSTPLLMHESHIDRNYKLGDQRKYFVKCLSPDCRHPQPIEWRTEDKETGIVGGFVWRYDEDGMLIQESVKYLCQKCGHPHEEHDKERLFSFSNAEWVPTAKPTTPNRRSYHLSGLYSPVGFEPWHGCVSKFLVAYDVKNKRVKDMGKYQRFYNNVLGEPFEVRGFKIRFEHVSHHRRLCYKYGEVPNTFADQYMGSKVLFLTLTVDVHDDFLAAGVIGWTRDQRSVLIDYVHIETQGEGDECPHTTSTVWPKLREYIENKHYSGDDGTEYGVLYTFIDANYGRDTVVTFCSDYVSNVFPIIGTSRPAKAQTIRQFAEFKTQLSTTGYRITVDDYKDRLAPVMRREWVQETGIQDRYHFNAPIDITNKQLKELTAETRQKVTDKKGHVSYEWKRRGRNELWDLHVYGHAAVEVLAWNICVQYFEVEEFDWGDFWEYAESGDNDSLFNRVQNDKIQ